MATGAGSSEGSDAADPESTSHRIGPIAEQVYSRILEQLQSIAIEPGQRLAVDALARSFGISQTPVREALGRLESDGLVVKSHLRGFRATPLLTVDEVETLFTVRMLLEPFVAARAAQRRSPEHIDDLEALHQRMSECEGDPGRHGDFAALDAQFHDVLACVSDNNIVRDVLRKLHSHMHIFRLRHDKIVAQDAIREHRTILDAVIRRDHYVAEAAMKTHLDRARLRVLEHLQESAAPPQDFRKPVNPEPELISSESTA